MLPAPFTSDFLNRLETLRLRTRKEVLGNRPGAYSSPRRGTSLEFADYRKYSPGDDLRYLDWGIFARSDRLYVRLFHEEVDLFAYIFIDGSGSMAFPSAKEKFSPARNLALALSYVVLANHDRVRLHCLKPLHPAERFLVATLIFRCSNGSHIRPAGPSIPAIPAWNRKTKELKA